MSHCSFDPSKSVKDIFTDRETYKLVGLKLLFIVGINTLATTVLGGSKKQAVLIGTASAIGADITHFTAHRVCNEAAQVVFLLSGPIIALACSHFSHIPILSTQTLVHTVSPIAGLFATIYLL